MHVNEDLLERKLQDIYRPSHIYTSKELTEIFEKSFKISSVILFEGAPGIGKTMVAKEIAYRWATGEMLTDIKLLLLIFCRSPELHNIQNFPQLMEYFYEDDNIESRSSQYFSTKSISGKGLMIVLDGFDELPEGAKCKELFLKLIHGDEFKNCSIIITSRSHMTPNLFNYCNCRIEIFGFAEEDRRRYLQQCLLPAEECGKVIEFFEQNPMIDSLCYIPLNMANFITLVFNKEMNSLPRTQTELTGEFIRIVITHYIKKAADKLLVNEHAKNNSKLSHKAKSVFKSIIKQEKLVHDIEEQTEIILLCLAKLAYKMTKKKILIVEEDYIRRKAGLNIIHDHNVCGLLQSVKLYSNNKNQSYYSFMHFSFQEYLAAYHLTNKFTIKQTFKLHKRFWEPRYLGLWKMYVGITKGSQFPLQQFLSGENYFTAKVRYTCKIGFPGISEKININKVKCLQLYQLYLETPDNEIKQSISTVVKDDTIDLSKEDLSVADIEILGYFIAKSYITMNWTKIDLSECHINDATCNNLRRGISLEDGRKKPIIQCLKLSSNKIKKLSTLIHLVHACNIKSLIADGNLIEVDDCSSYHHSNIESLDLSNNMSDTMNVVELCKILLEHKHLKTLQLKKVCLNDEAISTLFLLCIQWNKFEKLEYDRIDNKILFLMQQVREGSVKLEYDPDGIYNFIKISNSIETVNFKCIDKLSKISTLSLTCKNSQGTSIGNFLASSTNALKYFQRFSNLSMLNLSGIQLQINVCEVLCKVFKNNSQTLKYLILNECGITTQVAETFFEDLKVAKSMIELHLCGNSICNDATETLANTILYLNSLKTLKVEKNKFKDNSIFLFNLLIHDMHKENYSVKIDDDIRSANTFLNILQCAKSIKNSTASRFRTNIQNAATFNVSQKNVGLSSNSALTQQLSSKLTNVSYFKTFIRLFELNISGITVNDNMADDLAVAFETNLKSTLQILKLCTCELQSSAAVTLFKKLRYLEYIRTIEICHNYVNNEAVEELVIAIVHMDLLEVIKFSDNPFGALFHQLLDFLIKIRKFSGILLQFDDHSSVNLLLLVLSYIKNISNVDSSFVKRITQITDLRLLTSNLDIDSSVSEFFHRFHNLKVLNLTGIIIHEKGFDLSFIRELSNLQNLTLNSCDLKSKTVVRLVECLQGMKNVKLTELQLNDNQIKDKATKSLIIAFLTFDSLRILSVENNKFNSTSITLLDLIRNETIHRELTLSKDIYVDCFLTILHNIPHSTKCEIFLSNIQRISILNISCKFMNMNVDVNELKKLNYFTNLKEMSIVSIHINEAVIDTFMTAFAKKRTIKMSSQGPMTTNLLAMPLPSLEVLNLSNCNLNTITVTKILKEEKITESIKSLDLSSNSITDEAVITMISAFLQMPCLIQLNVTNNNFKRYECIQMICNIIIYLKQQFKSKKSIILEDDISAFIHLLNILNEIHKENSHPFLMSICQSIETLNMNNFFDHSIRLTRNVSLFIHKSINLLQLDLNGFIIDSDSISTISEALAFSLCSLEKLSLKKCGLNSNYVKILLPCEKHSIPVAFKTLKAINFECNQITDDATDFLAKSFLHIPYLTPLTLNLNNNLFKNNRMHTILDLLFNLKRTYSTIYYSYQKGDKLFDYVSEFLTLMSIMNDLSEEWSLQVKNCISVKRLILHYSNDKKLLKITENAVLFLHRFTQLTELIFSGICIGDAKFFGTALTSNKASLVILSLNNCQLDVHIADSLRDFVNNNPVLTELSLSNNVLESEAAMVLAEGLASYNVLQKFYIDSNKITDEAAYSMIKAFLQMYYLQDLNIDNNQFRKFKRIQLMCGIITEAKNKSLICCFRKLYSEDHVSAFLELFDIIYEDIINDKPYIQSSFASLTDLKLHNLVKDSSIALTCNAALFLKKCVNLSQLDLCGINIKSSSVTIIAEALAINLCSLEKLSLMRCGLTTNTVEKLFSCEEQLVPVAFKTLKAINLEHNRITDDAIVSLIKAFTQIPNLATEETLVKYNLFSEHKLQILFNVMSGNCMCDFNSFESKIYYSFQNGDDPFDLVSEFLTCIDIYNVVSKQWPSQLKNCDKIKNIILCFSNEKKSLKMTKNSAMFFNKFTQLTLLSFSGIHIESYIANVFVNSLASSRTSLVNLSLTSCQLDSFSADPLRDFVNNNLVLTELSLSNNALGSKGVIVLAEGLASCKKLQKFYIDSNKITDEAVYSMVKAFIKMPNLKDLNTDDNEFQIKNIHFICDIITDAKNKSLFSCITTLYSEDHVSAFLRLLDIINKDIYNDKPYIQSSCASLTDLKLHNLINDYSVTLTYNAALFFKKCNNLTQLDLCGIIIGNNSINIIAEALAKTLYSLTVMSLKRCGLTSKLIKMLFSYKGVSLPVAFKTLKTIDLQHNQIKDDAIGSIVKALIQIPNLTTQTLVVDHNLFTEWKIQKTYKFLFYITDFTSSIMEYSNKKKDKSLDYIFEFLTFMDIMNDVSEEQSFQVKNCISVKKLTLHYSNNNITLKLTENAMMALTRFTQLSHLSFSGICIKSKTAIIFGMVLKSRKTSLQVLSLSNCKLHFRVPYALNNFVTNNEVLTKLILSKNELEYTGAIVLSWGLAKCKKIQELYIDSNKIKDEAVHCMMKAFLQMPSLKVINVDNNRFTIHKNFQLMCNIIIYTKNNSSVTYLTKQHSKDNVLAFLKLIDILKEDMFYVTKICNQIINLELHNLLYRSINLTCSTSVFIQKCANLKQLDLQGIIIYDNSMSIIAKALTNTLHELEILSLKQCALTSNTVKKLFLCERQIVPVAYKTLRAINLEHNEIGDDAIDSLIKAFIQMPNLTMEALIIEHNKFTDRGRIQNLLSLMFSLKTLKPTIEYSYKKGTKLLDYVSEFLTLMSVMNEVSEEWSLQVKNCIPVKRLILHYSNDKKSLKTTENAVLFLHRFTQLTQLNFSGICIGDAKFFGTALISNKASLVILSLINCQLDVRVADSLRDFVNNNSVLTELNLSNNILRSKEVIVLTEGLASCNNLQKFYINSNKITDEAAYSMIKAFLQMCYLQDLNINNNQFHKLRNIQLMCDIITEAKNKLLICCFRKLYTEDRVSAFLELLDIIYEDIVNDKPYIQSSCASLTDLKLHNLINDSLIALTHNAALFLKKCINLSQLDLCGINIGSNSVTIIAEALAKNLCLLEILSLMRCGLTTNSVKTLFSLVEVSVPVAFKALKTLNLEHNQIGDDAIYPLVKAFIHFPNLTKVNASHNLFKKWGINNIFDLIFKLNNSKSTIEYYHKKGDKSFDYVSGFLALMAIMNDVPEAHSSQVKNCISIERLILHYSHEKSLKITEASVLFLNRLTQLTQLIFSGICIESQIACNFGTALISNKTSLVILSLNNCQLDYHIADSLRDFVNNNSVLTELSLSNNVLGSRAAIILAEGLASCAKLQRFYIGSNNIANDAANQLQDLMTKLCRYGCLSYIDFTNNRLSENNLKIIYSAAGLMSLYTAVKLRSGLYAYNRFSTSNYL